jgi:hypothetical protein
MRYTVGPVEQFKTDGPFSFDITEMNHDTPKIIMQFLSVEAAENARKSMEVVLRDIIVIEVFELDS